MRVILPTLLLFALAAAGRGEDAIDPGLESLFDLDGRVATIGYRLATANNDLCAAHSPHTGLIIHSLGQYGPAVRMAVAGRFGLGNSPAIQFVVPSSAAAGAGLVAKDSILAINRQPVSDKMAPKADYAAVQSVEENLEKALEAPPAILSIRRDTSEISIRLTGAQGCKSRFQIVPGRRLNASADGTYVQLTSRVAYFAANDDELAMLIAHEFAHNVLQHSVVLDRIGRTRRNIRETEGDADYWGLYLLIKAGYDGDRAIQFWDRFERKTNAGILADGSHLSRKDRIALAALTLAEIKAKQAQGIALTPERRRPF